jgi:hypothetical protein
VIDETGTEAGARRRVGALAATVVLLVSGSVAVTVNGPRAVDFPNVSTGFKSDEATYYLLGHSLAFDGDLEYRVEDLARAWAEYPDGPQGVFLKEGQTIDGIRFTGNAPFIDVVGQRDPQVDQRLYYGKSFIYPALAAPFVRIFGTNGFLVFNALLLTAAFGAAYAYLSARMRPVVALLIASAFVFATVVPVYFTWIMPELFNLTLGLLAYFFWLHKEGRQTPPHASGLVSGAASDVIAGVLIGVATFSKVTNGLLLAPMVVWLILKRRWLRALSVSAVWGLVVFTLFAINTGSSGDWNYQGGRRGTFYNPPGFPFQSAQMQFDVGAERGRDEALTDVIFDPEMFWQNFRANVVYFFIGRYSGLIAYFFPAFFGIVAMLTAPRGRPAWQWLVLAGLVAQMLVFIVSQPYTYFGGGGSVGNRYFMGAYGMSLFLIRPGRQLPSALLMWTVGLLFMAKLVLNPFYTSLFPYKHAMSGPLRLLPVELTNVNDLPTNTNRDQTMFGYGQDLPGVEGYLQLYHLDDNMYLKEADGSVWIRGDARAEMLIKTDQPFARLQLTFRAGPVPASATVTLGGETREVTLPSAGATAVVQFPLPPGFLYKKDADQPAKHVWVMAITAGKGFVPVQLDPSSRDKRYLGINVTPRIFK